MPAHPTAEAQDFRKITTLGSRPRSLTYKTKGPSL
jgi:hypothetical protein